MSRPPAGARSILVIDPDSESSLYMQRALARQGFEVSIATAGKEGLIAAYRDQPDIIILELELPDIDALDLVHRLRRDPRTDRKTLISVTRRSRPEDAVAGLEAGLDYYILKQADTMDVLLRYLSRERPTTGTSPLGPGTRAGTVISFLSAKGGVGTSSLCLNVASEVARLRPAQRISVIDLALPMGNLAAITGMSKEIDVIDATHFEPATLTPELLRKQMPLLPGWGFHILPGSLSPSRAPDLRPDRLAPMLQSLRAGFAWTFVDLGKTISRLTLFVLSQSSLVVVVMSPDPIVASSTRALLDHMSQQHIDPIRIYLLSNRPGGSEDLTGPPLENLMGRPINLGWPYVGQNLGLANSRHAPYRHRFPDDTASLILEEIANDMIRRATQVGFPGGKA